MSASMLAFTGTAVSKGELVASLEAHAAADRFVQGHGYWRGGKGCAVGCSLHDFGVHEADHSAYEKLFGIPRILARLEDGIFESLPVEDAKTWPLRFANAVPVGADLSLVWPKFAVWLLVDKDHGVVQFANENGKLAIQTVADLYARQIAGDTPTRKEFEQARSAAAAAYADAAADAAAAYAYADAAAADAAYAYAYAAADAAYAAAAYAYAAADADYAAAADAAADADYAWRRARRWVGGEVGRAQAGKLIELIAAAGA